MRFGGVVEEDQRVQNAEFSVRAKAIGNLTKACGHGKSKREGSWKGPTHEKALWSLFWPTAVDETGGGSLEQGNTTGGIARRRHRK